MHSFAYVIPHSSVLVLSPTLTALPNSLSFFLSLSLSLSLSPCCSPISFPLLFVTCSLSHISLIHSSICYPLTLCSLGREIGRPVQSHLRTSQPSAPPHPHPPDR